MKGWKKLFKRGITGKKRDVSELSIKNYVLTMNRWTGVRLLESILKNRNLYKSLYAALKTKKLGRSHSYKIKDWEKSNYLGDENCRLVN